MAKDVIDVLPDIQPQSLANRVADFWTNNNNNRANWLAKNEDTRKYLTATNTGDTAVGQLPWKNKTVIPKLTQIADNLQSYYMAALMPDDDWFIWLGDNVESQAKADVIEDYMKAKLKSINFRRILSTIIKDWVYTGGAFGGVTWTEDYTVDPMTGDKVIRYVGPKPYRISGYDCMINPTAKDFNRSWFIKRDLIHKASLASEGYATEIIEEVMSLRGAPPADIVDQYKDTAIQMDGFANFGEYLASGYIEILEFWGDLYDTTTGESYINRHIVVADRAFVLVNRENPSWSGGKPFMYCGWRGLPDNLYAQGPLDQLVGMQYRCDHLENLKADAFDQIVHPMWKIKGDEVEPFLPGPDVFIHCGLEGDVDPLRPDTLVLQADNQIVYYHGMMEQMAGSPKDTMGFRTPGEKTAFEVNVLQQGADRNFLSRITWFEDNFIEPMLNIMFELLMRNLNIVDVVQVFDDEEKVMRLLSITKSDIAAVGRLKPVGAKHYAARNRRVQELNNFVQIVGTLPSMARHFSGLRAGEMLENELGFDKWNLFEENAGIREEIQGASYAQYLQQLASSAMGQPE